MIASPPGPPVRNTIGSAAGGWVCDGTTATAKRSVRPPVLARSSGTTSTPHRAPCNSGTGCGVAGQGPSSNFAGAWATVVGVVVGGEPPGGEFD